MQRWEARNAARVLLVRKDATPGDLKSHPNRLRASSLNHLLRDVADDADVSIRKIRVPTRRVRDRVDVSTCDVERGAVWDEIRDRAQRRLRDHNWVVRVDLLKPRVRADKPIGRNTAPRRFVNALVSTQRRVGLQPIRDPYQ